MKPCDRRSLAVLPPGHCSRSMARCLPGRAGASAVPSAGCRSRRARSSMKWSGQP